MQTDTSRTAHVAAEQTANLRPFAYSPSEALADALDPEYLETEVEDVELMTTAERQALNAEMARYWGID